MIAAADAKASGPVKWLPTTKRSFFDFLEENYCTEPAGPESPSPALRRMLSEARKLGAKSMGIERIKCEGVLLSETRELRRLARNYKSGKIHRITFWKTRVSENAHLKAIKGSALLGYVVLKEDIVDGESRWHVFESVFRKFDHYNNCVPVQPVHSVSVAGRKFGVKGVVYGQQNELNKACAQVALRTICSLHIPLGELSYARINRLAQGEGKHFRPGKGLNAKQVGRVLDGLGIGGTAVDYTRNNAARRQFPYQKFLYAGVESGAGAMLGFEFRARGSGHKSKAKKRPKNSPKPLFHVVGFFGHTFNQDLWVANAESKYFRPSKSVRYIPSETWLSNFLGHDDNHGSNFCFPRLYLKRNKVHYALSLLPRGVAYDGVIAESIASEHVFEINNQITSEQAELNPWLRRLQAWAKDDQIVLRAIAMRREQYVRQLAECRDLQGNSEGNGIVDFWRSYLPEFVWVIEISLPELFPINRRKLGEIILDATLRHEKKRVFRPFSAARLPSAWWFVDRYKKKGNIYEVFPSRITGHTGIFFTGDAVPTP